AVVHADRSSLNPGAQLVAVGAVLDEAPGLEVGEKVHAFMIPHPRSWPGSIRSRPLLPRPRKNEVIPNGCVASRPLSSAPPGRPSENGGAVIVGRGRSDD